MPCMTVTLPEGQQYDNDNSNDNVDGASNDNDNSDAFQLKVSELGASTAMLHA